jgi:hypothetical protein
MRRLSHVVLLLIVFFQFLVVCAYAQLETGNVTGRVTDSTGAVIQNLKVTLVNEGTNLTLVQITNAEGIFNFAALQPGMYKVTAKSKGFEQSQTTVELSVGGTAHADLALTVGSDSATVTVYSGGAYQLETQNATSDFVITKSEVLDLPLNGGNPYALAALVPGVNPLGSFGVGLTTARGAVQTAGNANFSTNGGTPGSNEILLDGVPITVCCQGQPALTPSVAILEQLLVITSVPPAQYGRSSGGILNYSTFSGENRIRGQLYDFFQNTKLHAAQFFAKADQFPASGHPGDYRSPLHYNQYGMGIGGPVVIPHLYSGINKTFFFAGYAGIDASIGTYSKPVVPTALMRQGNFSEACKTVAGAPDPTCNPAYDNPGTLIYDPNSYSPSTGKRTIFPNNQIPNMDTVAAAYLKFFPVPNDSSSISSGQNVGVYDTMKTTRRTDRQFSLRVDHEISASQRLLARATYTYNHDHIPDEFGSFNGVNSSHQNIAAIVGALQHTFVLSNRTVLTTQYGFAFQRNTSIPGGYNFTAADGGFNSFFASQQQVSGLPSQAIEGIETLGNTQILHNDKYTHAFGASVTTQLAAHTLITGIDFRDLIFNTGDMSNPAGAFAYTNGFVNGPSPFVIYPSSTATGMEYYGSFADFLLGDPSTGSLSLQSRVTDVQQYGALFVQDNWRTSAKLTLNLGLRYDVETGPTEKHNKFATFNPSSANPISATVGIPLTGGLSFRGAAGNSRRFFNTYWNQFSPRVGLAYAFNNVTVIRGGFGVLNLPTSQRLYGSINDAALAQSNFLATIDSIHPLGVDNPFPTGLNPLPNPSQGARAGIGTPVGGLIYNTPFTYVEQWHAILQQSLGSNFMFSLGYAGSHGVKLPLEFEANDLLPSEYCQPCTPTQVTAAVGQLYNPVVNPYYGLVQAGPYASPTIARSYLVDRYPQFQSVREDYVGQGSASYNSLQAIVRKRWSNGASVNITYTWSKNLGDVDDLTTGFLDTGTPGWQNSYFPKEERSYSTVDVPQRVVISLIGKIPYGHGQAFGKRIPKWEQAVLGNWQANGIIVFQSGFPIYISETGQGMYGGSRPDPVVGQTFSTGGSIRQRLGGKYSGNGYLNPAAFSLTTAFELGHMPRLCALCRTPGAENVDLSLFKTAKLDRFFSMQFRGEVFNALNHVQFAAPNTTFNGSTFGDITAQSNIPRTVQLAARLIW